MSVGGSIGWILPSKDSRFAVPTARLVNDLPKPHHNTSIYPKDSRFALPTARRVNDLLQPQRCRHIHSKDIRFAVPSLTGESANYQIW